MTCNPSIWNYQVINAFSRAYYSDLLTAAHQVGDRKPINLGTKDDPDVKTFYLYRKDNKIYALEEQYASDLPILVRETKRKIHYRDVYDIITSYSSARFRPEHSLTFRQLVDDLCCFPHSSPRDHTLWKIISFAALIGRVAYRVCSPPAFGKDSVMKVLGYLTGDVCVIANPTVAKLEYRLLGNKVIMLNEFANLKSEDKSGMEHFLQSVGDLSLTYEKRSRAGSGTAEAMHIGDVSILCAYNDLDCYIDEDKYYDRVFSAQTRDRYVPFRFAGSINGKIGHEKDPEGLAAQYKDYYISVVRSIMYYRGSWREELRQKHGWNVPDAASYGFVGRWAENMDRIRDFIMLYAKDAVEATVLLDALYNRHVSYLAQFRNNAGLLGQLPERKPEEVVVTEDVV